MKTALFLAMLAGQAHADHWVDMPAWPKPTPAAAHVRWVVSPLAVTFEVEADGITRAIILDPLNGEVHRDGFDLTSTQTAYVVRRSGDVLTLIERDLKADTRRRDTQVAKLHLPAKMKLETH